VGFLIDTTCSMGSTRTAMAGEFRDMVDDIRETITDAEYGYATFDDYVYGSMAYESYEDHPFILQHQITDNTSAVQASLDATLETHHGGDAPESSMEAMYQALTGVGYDQNCDGVYNPATDILPFLSSASDPFSGSGGEAWDGSISGGGPGGGMGFREDTLPVLIYATDNYMRDPEAGYGTPGGCSRDAGFSDVVSAAEEAGARLIGVAAEDSYPLAQMYDIAASTDSYFDADSDGTADTELVFLWTGTSEDFRNTVVGAMEWLLGGVHWGRVALEIVGDSYGFITSIDPEAYEDIVIGVDGTTLEFTLHLEGVMPAMADDTIYVVTLELYGDDTTLLASEPLIIMVPAAE
jgi:hypothetical protein